MKISMIGNPSIERIPGRNPSIEQSNGNQHRTIVGEKMCGSLIHSFPREFLDHQ
ncbi:hypothetical protein HUW46_07279 [Amycolatopsis sp. CA-230715]|nr:hypothetical protein HUW46_07279 [Amycolatopsis sp. CA-230715]